ncbi:MAG: hypothetical protein ACI8TQ_003774 [Planctomycetota bacterium]|jgi:hypothetical protein
MWLVGECVFPEFVERFERQMLAPLFPGFIVKAMPSFSEA